MPNFMERADVQAFSKRRWSCHSPKKYSRLCMKAMTMSFSRGLSIATASMQRRRHSLLAPSQSRGGAFAPLRVAGVVVEVVAVPPVLRT